MKISIITLQAIKNYGSVLQAYATQELFKEFGHDVEIINYVRSDVLNSRLLTTWCGSNLIKKIVLYPSFCRWKKIFDGFNKKYLNLTDRIYVYEQDFNEFPLESDIYCTGSDQVWNSKWNKGIERPLYLSFIPESKFKFAFSASFGVDSITDSERDVIKNFLMEYNYISVREKSGEYILKNQCGLENVICVMDPTLCMPKEFWEGFSGKRRIREEYILIYKLNTDFEFEKYARLLSVKTGLRIYRLCTRYDQFYMAGKSIYMPDVQDFVGLIKNAKYVLTDSFHATAFSVNMGVEPICVYPDEFGGRLKSFLCQMGMEDHHINGYNDFTVLDKKVDFNKVNKILDAERCKAKNFLNTVFDSARAV